MQDLSIKLAIATLILTALGYSVKDFWGIRSKPFPSSQQNNNAQLIAVRAIELAKFPKDMKDLESAKKDLELAVNLLVITPQSQPNIAIEIEKRKYKSIIKLIDKAVMDPPCEILLFGKNDCWKLKVEIDKELAKIE